MDCLYCGRKLSLTQRVKRVEHCSLEHRKRWEEQQHDLYRARLEDNLVQVQKLLSHGTETLSSMNPQGA